MQPHTVASPETSLCSPAAEEWRGRDGGGRDGERRGREGRNECFHKLIHSTVVSVGLMEDEGI